MTEAVREIAFDTETTGLEWDKDDRIIELGAVELINHVATGRTFQTYINPGRKVSEATIRITGITDDILIDKPAFEAPEVVNAFLDFVGDSRLVAHNAAFDRSFLNMELKRCGRGPIEDERWVDTLAIAKRKFPGAPASLDALCRRFDVNLEARSYHGALLDSQLLAEVYLELLGGRARSFDFGHREAQTSATRVPVKKRQGQRPVLLTEAEEAAHESFLKELGGAALWNKYA